MSAKPHVAIIGGGLAGMAAAAALAEHSFEVSLYEARNQLGGRAGSYQDAQSGELIDNCQHVNMGCCTNLHDLCERLGIAPHFQTQQRLYFVGPQGSITPFEATWLPAPFHLTRSFWKLPYLTFHEKRLFADGVKALAAADQESLRNKSFADWLRAQKQSENLIKKVWEVVLVSALSESLQRIDAAYAQKVFVDGFLRNRTGWQVEIPNVSLDELYSQKGAAALRQQGVQVHFQQRLQQLRCKEGGIDAAQFVGDQTVTADEYILAVPQHQIARFLPVETHEQLGLAQIGKIESAPITSVHLWFNRPITELPHAVFVDQFCQWLFARSDSTEQGGTHKYQIVISASRQISKMTEEEVIATIQEELSRAWPASSEAQLLHSRMITEKRAVFSVTPGIDALRPLQQTSIENLQLAGDWTQTGWPATMEGAVRSGYLAAENILRKHGIEERKLAPDLPTAKLSRWLFGVK